MTGPDEPSSSPASSPAGGPAGDAPEKPPSSDVEAIELRIVRLRLLDPVVTAYGVEADRPVLLVRVRTTTGDGWGECAALPEPGYSAEYVDGAWAVLVDHLLPRLAPTSTAAELCSLLAGVRGHEMAKSAVHLALLDAELRSAGRSLSATLGASRREIGLGVTIGIQPTVGDAVRLAGEWVGLGYRHLKLKIRPGTDVEPARAVRAAHPDISLAVDANGSYATNDPALDALDALGLDLIEQPLAADDLLGHRDLTRSLVTPIGLDETITSVGIAEAVASLGLASAVALKPGRLGGVDVAADLARRMHDAGVATWVGGMYETAIARAANLALAALPTVALPPDWSGSERYWATDVAPGLTAVDGRLAVPTGPGLGVNVDVAVLDELTVRRYEYRVG